MVEAPSAGALRELNALAARHGVRLQVRFFGFYSSTFDCKLLRALPDVSNLSIDCLSHADHIDELRRCPNLSQLVVGIFEGLPPDILASDNLQSLTRLVIGDRRDRNLDLSPLVLWRKLESFHVTGAARSLASIGAVPRLRYLSLSSIGRGQELAFISMAKSLRVLRVMLGGRSNLDEIAAPSLERLELCRVRGLSTLSLSSFPSLRVLSVEEQPRLHHLDLECVDALESLLLDGCSSLTSLAGWSSRTCLSHALFRDVGIDFDDLVSRGLPRALSSFSFWTKRAKTQHEVRSKLAALGFDGAWWHLPDPA